MILRASGWSPTPEVTSQQTKLPSMASTELAQSPGLILQITHLIELGAHADMGHPGLVIRCHFSAATHCASGAAPHEIGWFSLVVSHLSGKNKNAAKVGHPGLVIRCHFSAATRCASGAAPHDKSGLDSWPPTLSAERSGKDGARRLIVASAVND
jgi:hypothetical protein